jgi:DNA-binding NarL/FixJ family response regulator
MGSVIKCLAVDDHPSVLRGLSLVIDTAQDLELVDAVGTGEAALEAVGPAQPDVAIVDVRLPGIDGITTVKRLAEQAPEVATVVFSAYGDRRLLSDAIAAGARGYVMKGSPPEDLLRAIRSVAAGDAYVDPSLSPALLMDAGAIEAPLAEREREILQLLAAGLHTDEVAERIGLSSETVKSDTKRAMSRLSASGRVHAVANALRGALIE